jgi:hypothetical protein
MDEVPIIVDEEQIKKTLDKYPEIYYATKTNLRLVIEQRLKPKVEDKELIYQLLEIHGVKWEDRA